MTKILSGKDKQKLNLKPRRIQKGERLVDGKTLSKAQKIGWERKKLREQMFNELSKQKFFDKGISVLVKTLQDKDTKLSVKSGILLRASRFLAPTEISFEQPQEITDTAVDLNDFEACCKACGYPKPYQKQIDMAAFIFDDADEPRALLGTRKIGKTDYCTIIGGAVAIARDNATIVLITKEESRGREIVAEIARCLKCLGVSVFRKLTSEHIVLPNNNSKDPNIIAIPSKSGAFRGRHPKYVIADDIVVPADAKSPTERKRTKALYDELMKLTKRIRLIGQPVHPKDLLQLLRKKIKTMLVKHGDIPELDENLNALRLAGVDEASIQASYFLDISDVSNLPFADVETTDAKVDVSGGTVASLDPSHEGGDTSSLTIGKYHFEKFLFVGFAWRKAWYDCTEELVKAIKQYNIKRVFFENNALGLEPIRQLNALMSNLGIDCIFTPFKSLENKEGKIQNAGMFIKSMLMSNESNAEYKEQIFNYEIGTKENDDAPDSLANLLINLGLTKSAKEKN